MPRCTQSWIPFWERFLVDFCSQLRPTGSHKPWFFLKKNKVFSMPTWPPKNRFQKASKTWSILGSVFYRVWLHFGWQFGAMLVTFLGPRRPKRPPRGLQDELKTPPRRSQDASKMISRPKQGYPISPPGVPDQPPGFGIIFGSFSRPTGPSNNEFVGCFLDVFSMIFNCVSNVFDLSFN